MAGDGVLSIYSLWNAIRAEGDRVCLDVRLMATYSWEASEPFVLANAMAGNESLEPELVVLLAPRFWMPLKKNRG